MDGQHHVLVAQRRPQRVPRGVVKARVAERGRVFGEGQGVAALGGHPADLLCAELGIPEDGQRHGDEPARVRATPLVDVPVVVGPQDGEARSLSRQAAKSRALKPGKDGKFMEPRTPPAFMSLMRSWTSKQPGRISSKAVGSMPYSSRGRPATAFKPMFGMVCPLNTHTSLPSGEPLHAGRPVLIFGRQTALEEVGGSTRWSSTLTMIKSSACMVLLPRCRMTDCSGYSTRFEEALELQLCIPYPAVEQPVPSEHSMLVRSGSYVGPRSAGRAREEPDSLQSVLEAGPRERGSAEESLGQHASSVVGQDGDGVGPHRWALPVSLDKSAMEPLDQRVARVELVDTHPALELVEAHQIEHERRTHDPRWIPGQFVECLAQETLSRQHAVAHVAEGVGIRLPKAVQVLREIGRALADGLERDDAQIMSAALLAEEAKVLLAVGRDLAQAPRHACTRCGPARPHRERHHRRSLRFRAGSNSRPTTARYRPS